MSYAERPQHSNNELNRAGKILVESKSTSKEYLEAIEKVDQWRSCHAYPLNTFQSTLRKKVKKYKGSLVAHRLKRLPTIINKLSRFETLNLTQMQDIGGIRAVVSTVKDVREIQQEYKDSKRFTHALVTEKDYILEPKKDGYRGVHLVYRYHNTLARNGKAKDFEGLQIELQIRTQLQHTWATAVETVGTLKGESFKTGSGSEKYKMLFGLASSAFAITEKQPVLAEHQKLKPENIYKKIKKLEKELNFIENIKGLRAASQFIQQEKIGSYYNIVVLDTVNKNIRIIGFSQDSLKRATKKYAELEAEADRSKDVVLVSAGKLKDLKKAYPNYFLDVKDFLSKIQAIIDAV